MARSSSTFDKKDKRAKDAAKKQKRGVSMKNSLLRILELEPSTESIEELQKILGITLTAKQLADLLSATLVKEGLAGNIAALKEINDRVDGRVPESIKVKITNRIILEK